MKLTRTQLVKLVEQLEVQLAGCAVAAEGHIKSKSLARPGDYGWSACYQTVVDLRRKYDALYKQFGLKKGDTVVCHDGATLSCREPQ